MKYLTAGPSSSTLIVSRSRFLAFSYPVSCEEEVIERLRQLKKQFYDATHICYAAVWDELGNLSRFSDDGEPSGTAGAPIMDAIKAAQLKMYMVAVVRYFGGVKLGTGGLTRAYSSVSADCIAKSEKYCLVMCDIYRCTTDFSTFKRLSSLKGISDVKYGDGVEFNYACGSGCDITPLIDRAGGKIKTEFSERRFCIDN